MFLKIADSLCALIATLALIILSLKFVSKRLKLKKFDRFLMKIHKPATYVLIVTAIIHGILSFKAIALVSPLVYIFGFISLLCITTSVAVFYNKTNFLKKWKLYHGLLCTGALITGVLHIYFFINGIINP